MILKTFLGALLCCMVITAMGDVLEVQAPYNCYEHSYCPYVPAFASGYEECYSEIRCKHECTLINNSGVRWFYSIIDGTVRSFDVFTYEILPASTYVKYIWQKNSETASAPMRAPLAAPAAPSPSTQYIVFALTEKALKNALQQLKASTPWQELKDVVVVQAVPAMGAKNNESAASTLTIKGDALKSDSLEFSLGADVGLGVDLSKIVLKNRTYKPGSR